MTQLQHVYLTAHGEFTASPWGDERAQIGVRLALVDDDYPPTKGTPFVIPTGHGDIDISTGTTSGTHGTLSQTWTARLGPVGSTENADAAWQIDLAEDFWTFLNATKGVLSNGFRWTHVKIAPIDADGKTGPFGASTYDFTSPLAGTVTGSMLPPEVACCVSLRAPVSGRTGRGRMYMPALPASSTSSSGTLGGTPANTLANAAATFVAALDDSPGDEVISPCVMVTSAGKTTAVRPSEIRVGDHFDAQRRRQHQAVENYTTVSI